MNVALNLKDYLVEACLTKFFEILDRVKHFPYKLQADISYAKDVFLQRPFELGVLVHYLSRISSCEAGHCVVVATHNRTSPWTFVEKRYFSKLVTLYQQPDRLMLSIVEINYINDALSLLDEIHLVLHRALLDD